jgi:hypothetical protein
MFYLSPESGSAPYRLPPVPSIEEHPVMADTPTTLAQFREALGEEYGQYVAVTTIDINGARAFNVGDPVPVSHVERGVVGADQVKKLSTKAGQAAVAATTPKEG